MTELTEIRLRKLIRRTIELLVFCYLAGGVAAAVLSMAP